MVLKLTGYVIVIAAFAVLLAVVLNYVWHGQRDQADTAINLLPFLAGTIIGPHLKGRWIAVAKIILFVSILILWAGVHFWAEPGELSWHSGTMFGVMAMAGLILIYNLVRIWETAVSPQVKKRLAAACLATVSVFLVLAVLFMVVFLTNHWRAAMANWDLLLVVIYLPVFGLAWFVREALIKRKRGK